MRGQNYDQYVEMCRDSGVKPKTFGQWSGFGNADSVKLKKHAQINRALYKERIDSFRDKVWDGKSFQIINQEYADRAIATRKMREEYTKYSGSPELASDLLFELKLKADKEGLNFTDLLTKESEKISGKLQDKDRIDAPTPEYDEKVSALLGGEDRFTFCKSCYPVCAGHLIEEEKEDQETGMFSWIKNLLRRKR